MAHIIPVESLYDVFLYFPTNPSMKNLGGFELEPTARGAPHPSDRTH